jgi:hypothetical protein
MPIRNFLWHQGDCSEMICSGRPNNSANYYVLQWLREHVGRLRPELWRQRFFFASRQAPSHASFLTRDFFTRNDMTVVPHAPQHSVSPIEDKSERLPFWHKWGDLGRIAGGAEHPHRTWLSGCFWKMAEALGTVYMREQGLFWNVWWSVGLK